MVHGEGETSLLAGLWERDIALDNNALPPMLLHLCLDLGRVGSSRLTQMMENDISPFARGRYIHQKLLNSKRGELTDCAAPSNTR